MSRNINLTDDQWNHLYSACLNSSRDFLLDAINAAMTQKNKQLIDPHVGEHISHRALANIVYKLIKETDAPEGDGLHVRIDPLGKFILPVELSQPRRTRTITFNIHIFGKHLFTIEFALRK